MPVNTGAGLASCRSNGVPDGSAVLVSMRRLKEDYQGRAFKPECRGSINVRVLRHVVGPRHEGMIMHGNARIAVDDCIPVDVPNSITATE